MVGSTVSHERKPRSRGWPQYERAERQTHHFSAMLERLAASERVKRLGLAGIVAAGERCLVCRHSEDCARWLESGGGSEAPEFCGNARAFGSPEAV